MRPDRLNAFTDGVIAIIITIMVLELRVPHDGSVESLRAIAPVFGAYVLAFVNVGIYWANHHHMMQAARAVDGKVLWANLSLLFFLSLVPLVIRWIDESGVTALPVATYGAIMVCSAAAYALIEYTLQWAEGPSSEVRRALGSRGKEWLSFSMYVAGIPLAFVSPYISIGLFVAVSIVWLIPDRRFEMNSDGGI